MADEWVFDFVLAVFETPAWTNPIDDFIDAHCGLFEGAETGSENKLEWTTVHRQFCEMIETNLEKRLEEVGLSPEQFVAVLEAAAKRSPGNSTPRVLLEQLLAVEDFASFKRLMCKRRLEIEAETLRAIVAQAGDLLGKSDFHMAAANLGRSGSRPITADDLASALAALDLAALSGLPAGSAGGAASGSPRGAGSSAGPPGETDVARAIRESLLEAEAARRLIDYERKMLEAAIAESLQISAADAARLVDLDGFWGSDVAAVVISAKSSASAAASAFAASSAASVAKPAALAVAPAVAPAAAAASSPEPAPKPKSAAASPAAVVAAPPAATPAVPAAVAAAAPAAAALAAPSPARAAPAATSSIAASASVVEAATSIAVTSPPRTAALSSSSLPPLGFASSPLNPLPRLPALSPTSGRGGAKGTLDALQLSSGLFADGGDEGAKARTEPAAPESDSFPSDSGAGMSDADARAAAEVRARAAHWKRQREALLARKAEERARQLAEHERSSGKPAAVDAGKVKAAAQAAVAAVNSSAAAGGAGVGGAAAMGGASGSGSEADVRAAMRAAVMAKLRAEVP